MFLNSEDMSDDEDVGNSDIVVPLSLVASTPQIINGSSRGNGNRSALDAEDAPSGRSNQYNERLARARALNEQKRRVSSSSGARRESWVRARLGGVGESVRCGQRIGGLTAHGAAGLGRQRSARLQTRQAWSSRTSITFNGLPRPPWRLSTCCLRR